MWRTAAWVGLQTAVRAGCPGRPRVKRARPARLAAAKGFPRVTARVAACLATVIHRCAAGNDGKCGYECNIGSDCQVLGACCVDHQCSTGSSCNPLGSGGSGSGGGGGGGSTGSCKKRCTANVGCDDGLYCNGQEQCYAGCCAPALDTPCASHSACIVDSCDEASKKCSSQVVAAEDVDGDGHLAFGCTGGDDCNDADPTVYTGHAEVFDGKDNDCNGYIDDWTSSPKGSTSGSLLVNGVPVQFAVPIAGVQGAWLAGNWASGASTCRPSHSTRLGAPEPWSHSAPG